MKFLSWAADIVVVQGEPITSTSQSIIFCAIAPQSSPSITHHFFLLALPAAEEEIFFPARLTNSVSIPPLLAWLEDLFNQVCGVPVLSHAARYPEDFHTLTLSLGSNDSLDPGIEPEPGKCRDNLFLWLPGTVQEMRGQVQSLHPNRGRRPAPGKGFCKPAFERIGCRAQRTRTNRELRAGEQVIECDFGFLSCLPQVQVAFDAGQTAGSESRADVAVPPGRKCDVPEGFRPLWCRRSS